MKSDNVTALGGLGKDAVVTRMQAIQAKRPRKVTKDAKINRVKVAKSSVRRGTGDGHVNQGRTAAAAAAGEGVRRRLDISRMV